VLTGQIRGLEPDAKPAGGIVSSNDVRGRVFQAMRRQRAGL
jgi:hypothetical protein